MIYEQIIAQFRRNIGKENSSSPPSSNFEPIGFLSGIFVQIRK